MKRTDSRGYTIRTGERVNVDLNIAFVLEMQERCRAAAGLFQAVAAGSFTTDAELENLADVRHGIDCFLALASGRSVEGAGEVLGETNRAACN